jgi:hypothetical protein
MARVELLPLAAKRSLTELDALWRGIIDDGFENFLSALTIHV